MKRSLGYALLLSTGCAMAAEPVAFRADARVEVGADGMPTKVEASADLPEGIRRFIEQKVATWQFTPPARDGVVSAGVTFLSLGACAVPTEGGYRMGIDLKGNGPKHAGGAWMTPPRLPIAALRSAGKLQHVVTYIVEPDGKATLEDIEFSEPAFRRRFGIESSIQTWVASLRFVPEQLAGKPVRTRMRATLTTVVTEKGIPRDLRQDLRKRAERSPECQVAATGDGMLPVAVDSPIRVLTSG
jgi:hypothetical protein